MIENLLNQSTVKLKAEAKTWQEAGRITGKLLLDSNLIDQEYIERTIEGVYEFGPYIVLAPGMALFHARPESSVKEICLSMATLKTPVEFGAGDKDPVDLIFVLGAIDDSSHLELMAELMKILQDSKLIENIKNEENVDKVLDMIKTKLSEEN